MILKLFIFISLISLNGITLASNKNKDSKPKGKRMPIHWAVIQGDIEGLRQLIKEKVDVNAKDESGRTALQFLIMGRDYHEDTIAYFHRDRYLKLLAILLHGGADINTRNNEGKTPLVYCSGPDAVGERGDFKYGFARGHNDDYIYSPCADTIKYLVKRPGFLFKIKDEKNKRGESYGDWMLGVLLEIGDLKTLEFLIEKKNFEISKTILSYISERTPIEVIQYLLKKHKGIDINPRSYYSSNGNYYPDKTVLHYLSWASNGNRREDHMRIMRSNIMKNIRFLLDRGADVNIRNSKGVARGLKGERMPISYTVGFVCAPEVAKVFIQKGAIVDNELIDAAKKKAKYWSISSTQKYAKEDLEKRKKYLKYVQQCEEMVKLLESTQKKS